MVVDEFFHITHNLSISPVSGGGHLRQEATTLIVGCCRLRMQHEGNGQQCLEKQMSKSCLKSHVIAEAAMTPG